MTGAGKRVQFLERRLAAVTRWLEEHKPEVFREGLWDAVHEAGRDEGDHGGPGGLAGAASEGGRAVTRESAGGSPATSPSGEREALRARIAEYIEYLDSMNAEWDYGAEMADGFRELLALLDTESEPRLLFKDWPRRDADQSYALLDMDTTYPCTVTAMRAPDGSLVYQVTPPESEPVAHVTAIVDDDGLIADLDYLLPRELWAPEGDMVAVPLYTHPVGRAPAERDERYTLDEIEAAVDAAEVRYDPCYDGRTMCGLVTEELGRLRATPTETGGEG